MTLDAILASLSREDLISLAAVRVLPVAPLDSNLATLVTGAIRFTIAKELHSRG
jgi:hypothetical protein